jgi:hypothetical protein
MSKRLAIFCYLALTAASIAAWLDEEIRAAFRDLRVGDWMAEL